MFTIQAINRTDTGWLKIRVQGFDTVIFRSPAQAAVDCEESGICDREAYETMPQSVFNAAKAKFLGGQLFGDVNHVKAGTPYTLTENSKLLKKDEKGKLPVNPDTNKPYKVGEQALSKEDRFEIEEFLTMKGANADIIDAVASKLALNMGAMFGGGMSIPKPQAKAKVAEVEGTVAE